MIQSWELTCLITWTVQGCRNTLPWSPEVDRNLYYSGLLNLVPDFALCKLKFYDTVKGTNLPDCVDGLIRAAGIHSPGHPKWIEIYRRQVKAS